MREKRGCLLVGFFRLSPLVWGFSEAGTTSELVFHANTCPNWVSTVESKTNSDCERLCLDKDSRLYDFCLPVEYGTDELGTWASDQCYSQWIYGSSDDIVKETIHETSSPMTCQQQCQIRSGCVNWMYRAIDHPTKSWNRKGDCVLKTQADVDGALSVTFTPDQTTLSDTTFCEHDRPLYCQSIDCLTCSGSLRCVWQSQYHLSGPKYCALPDQCSYELLSADLPTGDATSTSTSSTSRSSTTEPITDSNTIENTSAPTTAGPITDDSSSASTSGPITDDRTIGSTSARTTAGPITDDSTIGSTTAGPITDDSTIGSTSAPTTAGPTTDDSTIGNTSAPATVGPITECSVLKDWISLSDCLKCRDGYRFYPLVVGLSLSLRAKRIVKPATTELTNGHVT
ncbi:MAG: hypothetical protein KVP17_001589 [Porospora cf. gigantea B]|uniref:uncharacterized protein n=1 Tax=Porospora cf. gigantea B TaxID=2853592 RepID=UPI0035719659|nr:MAG: hypothetical protein KVP17_001589 [Porospora cf. gigantea B]